MVKTYLKLLPMELRNELEKYLLFNSIQIAINNLYPKGKKYKAMIAFQLQFTCGKSNPVIFEFDIEINELRKFLQIPLAEHWHGIQDTLTDISINSGLRENELIVSIWINSQDRYAIIHDFTVMESSFVLLKFKSLLNDIDNKTLSCSMLQRQTGRP